MKKLFAILTIFNLSLSFLVFDMKAETLEETKPGVIRITPPAPKFTDAERQAELTKRRAEVAKQMSPNSILVMWSAEPRNYAGDVDFMYRQENNLYYLTNLKQAGATLVMTKNGGSVAEYLFLPKRNPQFETWNGRMYSNEDAQKISGVKAIVDATDLTNYLTALGKKSSFTSTDGININAAAETAYLLLPSDEDDSYAPEFRRELEFSKMLTSYKIENARPIFDELRLIKSPMEIKLLQHAIDITTEAQMRSMAMIGRAGWEYEVQAEVEYTFRRRNADYWGYPSIVGCGPNATTLHYVESQGEIKQGDLMLMDVGAEYDHYTADVTRTYPVNGKFSKAQTEIYQIIYDAQEAAALKVKPGASFNQLGKAATEVIKQRLAKLGLITAPNATYQVKDSEGKTVDVPQYRIWYMHGFGHWLGMNVHDVGDYDTPLKPGMIFTNEPGIYVRADALDYLIDTPDNKKFLTKVRPAFEKYKNIGVRIEDDLLVTETGAEWMTKNLPRKISDIEAFMARASKEFNYSSLPREEKPNFALVNFDANNFLNDDFNQILSGKTIRRGWIWTGKE